ncbi:bifunctional oligoribonuclease/PAP phosphatase NrnA [Virgibacillus sp. 179-BFC.A HS]|uniref:Bifunctional oligoribonuclease/PAP phosphatase NrnA n=1 Tax=Tigheibacillus jepli TaxID=3035914 RepID=A0ABU5CHN2_9BACI|nr:bifunctional oligoribonuclease/PAP phosphatase NrnA [Virgibacillus sp. 179-BFC.A HS]MDY0405342.1 bifunctional oligoribonuclease/PAP phosphatase NrnA [Virgibacillus sp. 179-BFC.A HS]
MIQEDILTAIEQFDTIIIHRHVRPDPDALGSQVGLQTIIKASFPKKNVYVVGESDPSLDFLAGMDAIEDSTYKHALVIVCDTANTDRIDDERFGSGQKLIKIDHHPEVDQYGDMQWVDTTASSTSEMIYELYLLGKKRGLQINAAAARLLYAGIVGDTGRFLYPSTTKRTMNYAGDLIGYDFDRQQLYDGMYQIDENIAKLKGYILQNYELQPSGFCTIRLTKDLMAKFNLEAGETSATVGTLGEIAGVLAWVMFVEEDDQIRARIRSKGPAINEIAQAFHGGGHPLASGATVYSWEEADKLCQVMDEACSKYQ